MTSRTAGILGVLLLLASTSSSATDPPFADSASGPQLVLVLSGGGARGVAHVGVLKVLEDLHVVPDMVIGTSMGSIVGGLYAAGWTPDEIQQLVDGIDWEGVFTDSVPRRRKSFRRKQDDRPAIIQGRLAFEGLKPVLPSGVIRGEKLGLVLRTLVSISSASSDFDELPIPYRAVAADIATGEIVVLDGGDLAMAIRASMSIPGAFPPVPHEGRFLVDGGVAANLPIGVAKELGAQRIIAVDISSRLEDEPQGPGSFASIVRQLNALLTSGNVARDTALLGPEDVLIRPDLGDISFVSFDRVGEASRIGEEAAREVVDELRQFAVDEERWQEFVARRRVRLHESFEVDAVRIVNASRIDDEIVRRQLGVHPPTVLDPGDLALRLLDLYNTRYFGSVDFKLPDGDGQHPLVVTTAPPDRGRGSLQFGIGFLDDFEGGSGYQLSVRHQLLPVNRWGGEWETVLQIGTDSVASTELYQPLDHSMRWFVAPKITFRRELFDLYFQRDPVAEYRIDSAEARLAGGRVLGRWGELRAAAFTADFKAERRTGDPLFPSDSERRGGFELSFRVDTVDEVAFPRHGAEVSAVYAIDSTALGSEATFERFWVAAASSFSFGDLTLTPYVEYGENLEPTLDVVDLFPLGGLFRLSGLGPNELLGERVALARLLAQWRLFSLDVAGIRLRLYSGISLEAGNTYFASTPMTADSLLAAGSIWVGAASPLGPARLAYGLTEGGEDRIYFTIGDRF